MEFCVNRYHLECLGMNRAEANCIDHYVCNQCDVLRAAGAAALVPANKRKKMKSKFSSIP
jgi:hypothetical protein